MDFPAVTTLETNRLTLRAPCDADQPHMPGVLGDEEISANTRNIPYPYTEADAKHAVERYTKLALDGKALTLFVEERETGNLVGLVVLIVHEPDKDGGDGGGVGELGYAIGRDWWGKGYATEAAGALMDYAFASLGFENIGAHTKLGNAGSGRVLEKLGMNNIGLQKESCEMDGVKHDATGFIMTRTEWEFQRT